jgi:seryl-tRNA synthetase
MLPIQLLRENPELVRRSLERRHMEAPLEEALRVDEAWRT